MAQHSRTTEIDSAADLLFGEGEEAPEEAEASTDRDVEDPEGVAFGEGAEEGAEAAPEEEGQKDAKPPAEDEEDEGAPKGRRRAPSGPGVLAYFAVPASGAVLILALGWTFAFIVRSALIPEKVKKEEVVKQTELALEKLAPPPPPEKPLAPTIQVMVPAPPPASVEEKVKEVLKTMKEIPDGIRVPLKAPFFIPLAGHGKKRGAKSVFLHLALTLSVSNKAALREVGGKRTKIRALVFEHYNRLSEKDLLTPAGREKSRARLVARLSKEIRQGKVQAVFFDEFFTR